MKLPEVVTGVAALAPGACGLEVGARRHGADHGRAA